MERTTKALAIASLATMLLAALILLAGCAASLPAEPATIRGVVTSVNTSENGLVTLRVVAHADAGAQLSLDAADVSLSPSTKVFATPNGSKTRATRSSASAIEIRDFVEVWITGPVRESYPVQADADAVLVFGRLKDGIALPVPPGLMEPPATP